MNELWSATATSLVLAIVAVSLALPFAVMSGWHAAGSDPLASAARQALRFLSSLPMVVIGLVVWSVWPSPLVGALVALIVGAYAPLALAVCSARAAQGRRPERDALALGLSPRAMFVGVVLPVLRAPVAAAALRTIGRLVGETALFLLLVGDRLPATLGATLLQRALVGHAALPLLAVLVLVPISLSVLAARIDGSGQRWRV
jgi:ABC-type Fe3+ transport system permease subunit